MELWRPVPVDTSTQQRIPVPKAQGTLCRAGGKVVKTKKSGSLFCDALNLIKATCVTLGAVHWNLLAHQ